MTLRTDLRARTPWLRGAARLAAFVVAAAVTLPLASCTTDVLAVEDPDIIDPGDVQSAAGADAVRVGALARLASSTSGGGDVSDNLFLLGGLFADEWINGDSFIARQEIDQRVITVENSFLTAANRTLNRARLSAEQAVDLLTRFAPGAPAWQVAEMHFVQAYTVNLMAEHLCSGLVFSTVVNGRESYGTPVGTTEAFERALKSAEAGLALVTGTSADDVRVRSALQVTRGRILMNLNRPAEAAAAVAGVATAYRYQIRHSCVGGSAACRAIGVTNDQRDDLGRPFHVQMLWTSRDASVTIVSGIEARMIEAEAQLRAGGAPAALATLNAARTTVTGLAPLTDAGTDAARVDQLFRERAFWLFSRGHRVGDLRRLIRQYGRPSESVFPTGTWHKNDAKYGVDVTIPVPSAEQNNPNTGTDKICINRAA